MSPPYQVSRLAVSIDRLSNVDGRGIFFELMTYSRPMRPGFRRSLYDNLERLKVYSVITVPTPCAFAP